MDMLSPGDAGAGRLLIVDDDAINRGHPGKHLRPLLSTSTRPRTAREGLQAILAQPRAPVRRAAGRGHAAHGRPCGAAPPAPGRAADGAPARLSHHRRGQRRRHARDAYELGVMDVISKPVVPYMVLRRVQSVIELFQARRRLSRTVRQPAEQTCSARPSRSSALNQGMIEALSTAIEFRSEESGEHVRRIHDITRDAARQHRAGRRAVRRRDDRADRPGLHHARRGQDRHPGRHPQQARPADAGGVRGHEDPHRPGRAAAGADPAAARARGLPPTPATSPATTTSAGTAAATPTACKGDEISVWAQVVSLADVYDALSCKRVYKDAFPREQVLEMIRGGAVRRVQPPAAGLLLLRRGGPGAPVRAG